MKPRFQSSDRHGRRWLAASVFTENWVEVVLTLLGLFYVTYRFIKLPLAPDEWGVLHSIRHHSFVDWFTNADSQDVNPLQHFLFSVVSRISFRMFPGNEIQRIRIPSLLAFGVFLGALWRMKRQFASRFIEVLTFAALLANAYVLDYFSVARGYGMGMAFALWSLASLLEIEDGKPGRGYMAVWSAVLAAMSNLSFLYFYGATLLAALFLSRHEKLLHRFWLASSALFVGVIYPSKILIMRQHNMAAFWWGGTHFVSDTILSLVKCSLYHGAPFYPWPSTRPEIALAWAAIGLALAAAIGLCWTRHKRGSIVTFCGLAIVALIYVGHYLLHVQFPVERAAMYFIPLFVLQIACLADGTSHRWLRSALAVLLLAYSVTVAWGLNLTHMCISNVMVDIPALIQDLTRIHQRNNNPVVLCVSDGTKWQVWYYAELATKLPEDERLQERECYARIDWLYIYEPHCGHLTKEGWISTPTTTDLFLSSDDYPPAWFLHDTVLLREYPVSHWRLYGRVGDAIAHDEDSLQLMPDFANGHFSLGTVLMRDGKIEQAIVQFEQALQIKPDYAEVHNNLGSALLQTGNLTEAIEHYEQALNLKPDYAEAHNNLANALLQAGKATEAIGHYEQALRLKLDLAETHNNLGLALAQAGRVQEAITQYQEALRLKPDYANAYFNLGLALEQIGALADAVADYQQVLRLKPDYTQTHFHLGQALEKLGRLDEAVEQYEQALQTNPGNVEAHISLGSVCLRMGDIRTAIGEYEEALRIDPNQPEAHSNLGAILQRMGRLREAVTEYELALQSKPDYVEAHFNLGLALEKLGRTPEAIQHYQQAFELRPEFAAASNALARLQTSQ